MDVTKPVSRLRCGDVLVTTGRRVFGVTQIGGAGTPVTVITAGVKRAGLRAVPADALEYREYPADAKVIVQVWTPRTE